MSAPAAKHTPGPWVYRTGMPYDWGWVTTADGGFITQAKDPRARDDETLSAHRAARTDPWEANARLISAAPDLLQALKEACEIIADLSKYANNHGAMIDDETFAAGLAAITKAEGRS